MTYAVGNSAAAYLAMLIPTIASGLLWFSVLRRRDSYRRRFRGWRLAWEMWISSAVITAVLFGAFYWYLFVNPFYRITVPPDGPWSFHYIGPAREVKIMPDSIDDLQLEEERLPILRNRRQYVRITLRDGRSLVSAPVPRADAARLFQQLQAQLPRSAGTGNS